MNIFFLFSLTAHWRENCRTWLTVTWCGFAFNCFQIMFTAKNLILDQCKLFTRRQLTIARVTWKTGQMENILLCTTYPVSWCDLSLTLCALCKSEAIVKNNFEWVCQNFVLFITRCELERFSDNLIQQVLSDRCCNIHQKLTSYNLPCNKFDRREYNTFVVHQALLSTHSISSTNHAKHAPILLINSDRKSDPHRQYNTYIRTIFCL